MAKKKKPEPIIDDRDLWQVVENGKTYYTLTEPTNPRVHILRRMKVYELSKWDIREALNQI